MRTKSKHDDKPPFMRHVRKRDAKPAKLCAYDFETTLIRDETPRPLYLTAYSPQFQIETRIRDMAHLTKVLRTRFLTMEMHGTKYVAWNGNRFDAYFIAAALIREDDLVLKPYLTRSKALRGMRVSLKHDADGNLYDERYAPAWEFLDGIAMLGLAGVSLERLLANFCPERPKLKVIDFEAGETFDPDNADHRDYAMRDSEGLYHAMDRAQRIMIDNFNQPLTVTMGGACIKIFQAHIPPDIKVDALTFDLERIVRTWVMRGGFCYCAKRYDGPVWKYDLNQAYAAAMREARLPAGIPIYGRCAPPADTPAIVRVSGSNPDNIIPFYVRAEVDGRMRSAFAVREFSPTWITAIEYDQLKREGWRLKPTEYYAWVTSFDMREYVDRLERLRSSAEGGPNGPIGTMVKATGNHSYGKTLEHIEPLEFVLAAECPEDCVPFYDNGFDEITHIFYRFDEERRAKPYHQPHLGAHITAHVRMVVRRAALLDPEAWLYADTDCVVFSRDVTDRLDIDPKRYGAWKVEESGTRYQIIAKKVYARIDGFDARKNAKAKGLNVRRLTIEDYAAWYEGREPVQDQVQLNNFLSVLCGEEMYRVQKRRGTAVEARTQGAV